MSIFSSKKKADGVLNEYSDTDYRMSDSDAHRDIEYNIPSQMKQLFIVIRMHLKLFSKSKMVISFIILVLLIPIAVYLGLLDKLMGDSMGIYGPGDYAGLLLGALPLMIALIPSSVLSKSIPSEFKDRTAYLNLALPQSRTTFYFGKFISGMTIVTFVFLLAYGVVIVMTTLQKGSIDAGIVIYSFIMTLVGCFAIGATTIALSTFMKKGSTILTFLFFYVLLPVVVILLATRDSGLLSSFQYLPSCAGDIAIAVLGSPEIIASPISIFDLIIGENLDFSYAVDIGVYMLWGLLFLLFGLMRFIRREM